MRMKNLYRCQLKSEGGVVYTDAVRVTDEAPAEQQTEVPTEAPAE